MTTMKSTAIYHKEQRRRKRRERTDASLHESRSRSFRQCQFSTFLIRVVLAAIAVGGTSISAADAFVGPSAAATRPLAIAVPSGKRRNETENPHRRNSFRQSITTRLHLFFNNRDEDGNLMSKTTNDSSKKRKLNDDLSDELRSPGISFPKRFRLKGSSEEQQKSTLVIRYMTTEDLKALVPMCIEEFGSIELQERKQHKEQPQLKYGLRTLLPRWISDPKQIPDIWEGFSFELLIYWTLRLKLMQGGNNHVSSSSSIPNDPVMLVLCEEKQPQQSKSLWKKSKKLAHAPESSSTEVVVGMVELSLQPPDADRNPPALPLPKWVKATLAKHTTMDGSLQGWVTNLLIANNRRGKGYSKLLMAAVEGVAQKWDCSKIYLHADADIRSGRIPQSLYEGLGYELVVGSTHKKAAAKTLEEEFAWAGKELERFSAIRMVDGVALLCYSKKL